MRSLRVVWFGVFSVATVLAQIANPMISSSKVLYGIVKDDVLRSAEKVPEEVWSFKPTPEVRTFGQLVAHVADAQYEFCGPAIGKKGGVNAEKSLHTKSEIIAALKDAYAFCDAGYASMTDADAAQMVQFGGGKMAKISLMDFNTAHSFEHYGNMVTYMRVKGIVPSSSEPRK